MALTRSGPQIDKETTGGAALHLSWLRLPAVFLLCRCLSALALYTFATPNGGRVTENPIQFSAVAWLSEIGTFLVVAALVGWVGRDLSRGWVLSRWWVGLTALIGYSIVAEIDIHLRRWMGLRLNLVFIRHLSHAAGKEGFWQTLSHFLSQDWHAILLSVFFIVAPAVVAFRSRQHVHRPRHKWTHPSMILIGAVALALSAKYGIAVRKWRMVSPWPYGVAMDVARDTFVARNPPGPEELRDLKELTGALPSPSSPYPLWNDLSQSPKPTSSEKTHKNLDVFIVAIESLRGWAGDLRSADAQRRLPNLYRLFRERGVFFPHAHSNGYPSGEGNMHLHLGVWSHPARAIAAEHLGISSRAFPEMLRDDGYQSRWLSGSDPSFDNLQHLMGRWFDSWEVVMGGDVALARGAIAAYDAMGTSKPRLISIYTASTHPFYELPESEGPKPDDPEQAYLKALTYADRAMGMIFDHIRKLGREDQTLFVITGDHAQPNQWQLSHDGELGLPNAGRTWTTLLIAGPGLPAGNIRLDASSHVDVPPTILGYLGATESNHFLGRDLFADTKPRPVVTVFNGGAAYIEGDTMLVGDLYKQELTKFKYDTGNNEDAASYQHGQAIPLEAGDAQKFLKTANAVKSFAWLADHDRLRPPATP
jgi:lipoteichoic acid synthase